MNNVREFIFGALRSNLYEMFIERACSFEWAKSKQTGLKWFYGPIIILNKQRKAICHHHYN